MKDNCGKIGLRHWSLLVFSVLFSALMVTSCSQKKEGRSSPVSGLIQVVRVTHRDFKRTVTGYGYLKAARRKDIVAYSEGIIDQIWVKEGDKVAKGERLLHIKGAGSLPEIARIKVEMEIAQTELSRQQKEYQRIKKIEKAGGSYAKEKKDVYANYKKALESFNAARQRYNFYINGTTIVSPINGYVTSLTKLPGNAVHRGELLASVVDLKNLIAEVTIFGVEANSVKPGQSAIITNDQYRLSGKVSFISTEINRETGGRKVGIEISQKKTVNLLPGDFVKADIIVEKHLSSLAIPKEAVLNDKGQKVVMVKIGQTYKKRPIVTGLHDQGYVEVLQGLSGKEQVVTLGAYELLNQEIAKKMKVED